MEGDVLREIKEIRRAQDELLRLVEDCQDQLKVLQQHAAKPPIAHADVVHMSMPSKRANRRLNEHWDD